MLQRVIIIIIFSLSFKIPLIYQAVGYWGDSALTLDVEKQLCRCQISSCDVGAHAAPASTGGWKLQPLSFPFSCTPVKPCLDVQGLINGRRVGACGQAWSTQCAQPGNITDVWASGERGLFSPSWRKNRGALSRQGCGKLCASHLPL